MLQFIFLLFFLFPLPLYSTEFFDITNISYAKSNLSGKNVSIAVVDSGVNPQEFNPNQVIVDKDFLDNPESTDHGTRMSKLITLVAPDVSIVSIRALGVRKSVITEEKNSPVMQAMQYLPTQYPNIPIVNLSIFGNTLSGFKITEAANNMPNSIFVVALGNKSHNDPLLPSRLVGASTKVPDNVLLVYALDKNKNLHHHSTYPDNGGPYAIGVPVSDSFATSQACAIASGAIALIKEKYPNYSASQIVNSILSHATPLNNNQTFYGKGLLNVKSTLDALSKSIISNTNQAPIVKLPSISSVNNKDIKAQTISTYRANNIKKSNISRSVNLPKFITTKGKAKAKLNTKNLKRKKLISIKKRVPIKKRLIKSKSFKRKYIRRARSISFYRNRSH